MYLDIHAKFRGDRPLRGRDLKGGGQIDPPPPPVKTCSQKAPLRKGSSLFNCRENTDRAIIVAVGLPFLYILWPYQEGADWCYPAGASGPQRQPQRHRHGNHHLWGQQLPLQVAEEERQKSMHFSQVFLLPSAHQKILREHEQSYWCLLKDGCYSLLNEVCLYWCMFWLLMVAL